MDPPDLVLAVLIQQLVIGSLVISLVSQIDKRVEGLLEDYSVLWNRMARYFYGGVCGFDATFNRLPFSHCLVLYWLVPLLLP